MTVTALTEIEACPRRWALSVADYPLLWRGRGYPSRLQLHAAAGATVHLAIEEITTALVRARCQSVHDAATVQVMRTMGGYSKVVNDCIDRVVARFHDNPRATPLLGFVAHALQAQVPELRARVQTFVSRLRLPQVPVTADSYVSKPSEAGTFGVFSEVDLQARNIGWRGRADLVTVTSEQCEIIDFKTGAPDDAHRFQIRVYALLWKSDTKRNPLSRMADRLVLAYTSGNVEVPAPTAEEIEALQAEIVSRRDASIAALSRDPPEARPERDHCRYCGVRQLCEEYWTAATQQLMAAEGLNDGFLDIEVTVTGRHGPSSWDAVLARSAIGVLGQPVLLRGSGLPFLPHSGQRLRLLSVRLSQSGEGEVVSGAASPFIVTIGTSSEAFIVSTS
jgi:hypothetical protein